MRIPDSILPPPRPALRPGARSEPVHPVPRVSKDRRDDDYRRRDYEEDGHVLDLVLDDETPAPLAAEEPSADEPADPAPEPPPPSGHVIDETA